MFGDVFPVVSLEVGLRKLGPRRLDVRRSEQRKKTPGLFMASAFLSVCF